MAKTHFRPLHDRVVVRRIEAGTKTKALALTMIIADETDEAAMAKWEHYKAGVDLEALDWSRSQAGADKHAADNSTAGRIATSP